MFCLSGNRSQITLVFKMIRVILLFSISILLVSCGTIMQGTTQEIGVSSNPSNASVTVNGQNMGNTPMILDLKRKNSYMVRFELPGYETFETNLTRKTSGWVWGNIVFGGIIGLVVDASAGGMYKLTPEQINAEMRDRTTDYQLTHEGIWIAVVLHPNNEWEKIGELKTAH